MRLSSKAWRPAIKGMHDVDVFKAENMYKEFVELDKVVRESAQKGLAVHGVERGPWSRLLDIGHMRRKGTHLYLRNNTHVSFGFLLGLPIRTAEIAR